MELNINAKTIDINVDNKGAIFIATNELSNQKPNTLIFNITK